MEGVQDGIYNFCSVVYVVFTDKYIKIIYFIFKKIIFNIILSK